MQIVDLRRDTTTRPDGKMRASAFEAALGDSVYGEDSQQNALERRVAEILGKEASIFLPSGTMGNLVALLTHTGRGAEIILEQNAHIRTSETGNAAAVAGLMLNGVAGASGVPSPDDLLAAIRPDNIHYPRTSLICLETPHYRYGGIVPTLESMSAIGKMAKKHELPVHLDGARIWNAAVALSVEPVSIARYADSVMASLSKGLGAPVGSILAGSERFITDARRFRKMLGGGMRQTGWLCASGMEALEPARTEQLRQDHRNAHVLAEGIKNIRGLEIDLERTQTNFVIAHLKAEEMKSAEFVERLGLKGVLATTAGPTAVRFVTCSVVDRQGIEAAIERISALMEP